MYEVDRIRHYCVTNMPGGVPQTSTKALTNATFPYLRALAQLGPRRAIKSNPALGLGVNTCDGKLAHTAVAKAFPDLPAF